MARVTGIGGVFFKAKSESTELATWYSNHLGIPLEDWGGAILKWTDDKAEDQGMTVWTVADRDSDWFSPSHASMMINYRVDNLTELICQLEEAGIEINKGPEFHENGQFAWIIDPDGNKVELWEPKNWNEINKK